MQQAANRDELFELLERKHDTYNIPDFIESDPIFIPHQFSRQEDIEISGFLTALIAWGRRISIIENAQKLMNCMDMRPYEFVMHASEEELCMLDTFVHRTFNGIDCKAIVLSLRDVYSYQGGLERIFCDSITAYAENVYSGIIHARYVILQSSEFPMRTHKHIANPARGSAAKRINMFLRWMVRQDKRGVDFGLWQSIGMHQLICPLDVHTGNVARKLGLLDRKQNDWKAAHLLTRKLKSFCNYDPVKYDFSLFGLGINENI